MSLDVLDRDPLRGPDDLTRFWRDLLGDDPPSSRTLWVALVDRFGRPTGFLTSVVGLPVEVEQVGLDQLFWTCAVIVADHPGSRVALCLQRAEDDTRVGADTAWAGAVAQAARRHRVTAAPLFLKSPSRGGPIVS